MQCRDRGRRGDVEGKQTTKNINRKVGESTLFYKSFICHKGDCLSSPELFDSLPVWADVSSPSSSSHLLLAVLLYRMVEKINRWKREDRETERGRM